MVRKIYAVALGRETGVFNSWDEAKRQVEGVPGAKHKSFKSDERELALAYLNNSPVEVVDDKDAYSVFCHIQECSLSFYNKGLKPKSINDIGGFVVFFSNKDKVGGFKYQKRIENQFEAWACAIFLAVEYAIKSSVNEQIFVHTPSPSSFSTQSTNKKANKWIKKAENLALEHDRKIDVRSANKKNNPCAFYFNENSWRR